MTARMDARAERSPFRRMTSLWFLHRVGSAVHVAQSIFQPVENGEDVEPSVSLEDDEAQQLMDELWRCGFRPTEGSGSAGALAATEKHLEDMRRLVFKEAAE